MPPSDSPSLAFLPYGNDYFDLDLTFPKSFSTIKWKCVFNVSSSSLVPLLVLPLPFFHD